MKNINEIIVHCSSTPEGRDYTIGQLEEWHRQQGFQTIGYNYVIYRDGSCHKGRPLSMPGAHCKGHNAHSIGICYIGGVAEDGKTPKDTRTPEQRTALARLLRVLHVQFPKATLHGHREFANKACPSFDCHEYDYIFNI
ncbi:MAG: N-acetylmuramoyl-L-alanine amidase [Prevotella sp.]|nr:N-acetylmuramoyl-L-alanine amidase [Prevotella sp.]